MSTGWAAARARFIVILIVVVSVGPILSGRALGSGAWLSRLNQSRSTAKLGPVSEEEQLSQGCAAHARYLVENYSDSLHSKQRLGVDVHVEESGRPGYSYAGFVAGRSSDVLITSGTPLQTWAIDRWMSAPFHRFPLLDPSLQRVGYGDFCANRVCAAVINIRSGSTSPTLMIERRISSGIPITGESEALGGGWGSKLSAPVKFPPDSAIIDAGHFPGGEWPDPLTSCPGYSYPVGIPITLQTGRVLTPRLTSWSLTSNGTSFQACGVDSQSYRNPDQLTEKIGRNDLEDFGAVILVPRSPLKAGGRYDVTLRVDDVNYSWSFSVSPAAQTMGN
jgi:hypothetical protein